LPVASRSLLVARTTTKSQAKINHESTPTPSSFVFSSPAKLTAGKLRAFVVMVFFGFE
jgi:hypothetical protein